MIPVFATGTGRCGTHLLQKLFDASKHVDSYHNIDLYADSFYRYCLWNNIDVDFGPFLDKRKELICLAEDKGSLYFESEPYLANSISLLEGHFQPKFIHIVRNPVDVVKSHIVKGWYDKPYVLNSDKISGYQYGMKANHFLGRIIPRGNFLSEWIEFSQVGKIAWMWAQVNKDINRQLSRIDSDRVFFLKIEDLNYKKYLELLNFSGSEDGLNEKQFNKIVKSRPGKGKKKKDQPWSERELREFEDQIGELLQGMGYS